MTEPVLECGCGFVGDMPDEPTPDPPYNQGPWYPTIFHRPDGSHGWLWRADPSE